MVNGTLIVRVLINSVDVEWTSQVSFPFSIETCDRIFISLSDERVHFVLVWSFPSFLYWVEGRKKENIPKWKRRKRRVTVCTNRFFQGRLYIEKNYLCGSR